MKKPVYAKSFGPINLSAKEGAIVAKVCYQIVARETVCKPSSLVEAAADPRSPIHHHFNWNDKRCGVLYREHQARMLIASVFQWEGEGSEKHVIRTFVNVSPRAEKSEDLGLFVETRGYVPISSLVGRQNYSAQVLSYARNQLIGWRNRFGYYREFLGVVREIDKVLK